MANELKLSEQILKAGLLLTLRHSGRVNCLPFSSLLLHRLPGRQTGLQMPSRMWLRPRPRTPSTVNTTPDARVSSVAKRRSKSRLARFTICSQTDPTIWKYLTRMRVHFEERCIGSYQTEDISIIGWCVTRIEGSIL
jgi:hypothetical protein